MAKSVRQLVLAERATQLETNTVEDVIDKFHARMGHAVHEHIERAWADPETRHAALTAMGHPEQVINRIIVNPTEHEASQNGVIPIYMEIRSSKEFMGYTISGQFDFVAEGRVEDFKTTRASTVKKKTNESKFIQQASIYRWLRPDIITKNTVRINYLIKDWSEAQALSDSNYPQAPVVAKEFPLLSVAEVEAMLREKLTLIDKYRSLPEDVLPLCNATELWQDAPLYKYYSKVDAKRATKSFDTDRAAAHRHLLSKGGKGIIRKVPQQVRACKYCEAAPLCSQRKQLQESGLYKPD